MTIKDILVYADGHGSAVRRLDTAAMLARTYEAHLTALFARMPPYIGYDVVLGANEAVMRWQEQYQREASQQATKAAADAARRVGVEVDMREMHIDPVAALRHLARTSDLVVLSQGRSAMNSAEAFDFIPAPGEVIMSIPCPLLVVPRTGAAEAPGKHVVIAWKPTRESARAVNDSLPILARADSVTIVEVREAQDEAYLAPASDVAMHLSRHGIHAHTAIVRGPDADAGELLLAEVARREGDLLVMGAYGHTRFKEFVLGGVTRHVLANSPVPLLLSH